MRNMILNNKNSLPVECFLNVVLKLSKLNIREFCKELFKRSNSNYELCGV